MSSSHFIPSHTTPNTQLTSEQTAWLKAALSKEVKDLSTSLQGLDEITNSLNETIALNRQLFAYLSCPLTPPILKKIALYLKIPMSEIKKMDASSTVEILKAKMNEMCQRPTEDLAKTISMKEVILVQKKMQSSVLELIFLNRQHSSESLQAFLTKKDVSLVRVTEMSGRMFLLLDSVKMRDIMRKNYKHSFEGIFENVDSAIKIQKKLVHQVVFEGNPQEIAIKESIRCLALCTLEIKHLIYNFRKEVFANYIINDDTYLAQYIEKNMYSDISKKLDSMICHIRPELLLTTYFLNELDEELAVFKAKTINRADIELLFPHLPMREVKRLFLKIREIKEFIIVHSEEADFLAKEIVKNCSLVQSQEWQIALFDEVFGCIENDCIYQSNGAVAIQVNFAKKTFNEIKKNSEFIFSPEYELSMQQSVASYTIAEFLMFTYRSMTNAEKSTWQLSPLQELFQACQAGDHRAVKILLKQVVFRNSSINTLDENNKTILMLAAEQGYTYIVSILLGNSFLNLEVDNSKITKPIIISNIQREKQRRLERAKSKEIVPSVVISSPTNAISTGVAVDDHAEELLEKISHYFSSAVVVDHISVIGLIENSMNKAVEPQQCKQYEIDFDNFCLLERTLFEKANKILAKNISDQTKLQQCIPIQKQHKRIVKSIHAIEKQLLNLLPTLEQESSSSSSTSSTQTSSPSAEIQIKVLKKRSTLPVINWSSNRFVVFRNMALESALKKCKEIMSETVAILKMHLQQKELQSVPGLQINAILFTVMTFMEKRKNIFISREQGRVEQAKQSKYLRNALVHCKGLIDEEVLAYGTSATLQDLHQEILDFSKMLIQCIEKEEFSELKYSVFYQKAIKHGKQLELHIEEVSSEDRVLYTQRLSKQFLSYSTIDKEMLKSSPGVLENGLKMIVSKMQIYSLHQLPAHTVKLICEERHDAVMTSIKRSGL